MDYSAADALNDARFNEQLAALADALGADAKDIVRDEARLLTNRFIKITPPRNKAQGEKAVSSDVSRAFTIVRDDYAQYVSAHFGVNGIREWLTNAEGERYKIEWEKLDMQGYGMKPFHNALRNERGRVPKRYQPGFKDGSGLWQADYVVSKSAFLAFLASVKARVGRMKSGWLQAYYRLGGKVPAWIQRHIGRELGGFVDNLNTPGNPNVTISNHATGIASASEDRIFRAAMKSEIASMRRRIQLIVSGYAKDVAAKMRVNRKFTMTEPEAIE